MAPIKKFQDKKRIPHRRKESILLGILGMSIFSTKFCYKYVINTPLTPSDFPTINIITEGEVTQKDYVDCTIELEDKKSSKSVEMIKSKIKLSWSYNAKYLPK